MNSATATQFDKFIQIDEDGYFKLDGLRVADPDSGRDWLSRLVIDSRGRAITEIDSKAVIVEAFDEPYIALDIAPQADGSWIATMPYRHSESFELHTLTLDEWDRFHGRTKRGVPFVLSRACQSRFFDLLDSFEDDSITFRNKHFKITPWLSANPTINSPEFWSEIYRKEQPRWDLGEPSHALVKLVPQLKLQRARVLVLGAGAGHDAAWFASQGHIVTAVDFSEEAVSRARTTYRHLSTLKFVQADVFALPGAMNGAFDIVFEHTCYCAISPERRAELVKVWKRVLVDQGHLMGIFFAMDKPTGPPFGGSEWELRSRLSKIFRPLYWTRLRDSRENRLGHELFVYAQKLSSF